MNELYQELKKYGRVKANEPLAKHTTFKIGGPAEFLVIVEEADKLADLLNFLNGEGTAWRIIGGGSNVLAPDEGLPGVIIKVSGGKVEATGETLVADAGARFAEAVEAASKNSLSGLEWAVGIPGTIGGAIRGNAGALGFSIGQSVEKVLVWQNGEATEMSANDCEFNYRESVFKKQGGVIILKIWLKLIKKEPKDIIRLIQENTLGRARRLPTEPSAGSFFKNISLNDWKGDTASLPPNFIARKFVPAGWLIEQSGLKGERVNDAAVSDKHGNFIVNLGRASQADVLSLVEKIKEKVYNKYGIWLEPEVEILKP